VPVRLSFGKAAEMQRRAVVHRTTTANDHLAGAVTDQLTLIRNGSSGARQKATRLVRLRLMRYIALERTPSSFTADTTAQ
jgi:hypothetical protein